MKTKNKSLTLTVSKLLPMRSALSRLSTTDVLPITTSFRLARLITQIEGEFRRYEEARVAVIKKYGTPVERTEEERNGVPESYNIPAEKAQAANDEVQSLLDEDVVVPSWKPLVIKDFGEFKLSPVELSGLMPLLDINFLEDDDEGDMTVNTDMGEKSPDDVPQIAA